MKKFINTLPLSRIVLILSFLLTTIIIFNSCRKDNFLSTSEQKSLLKLEGKILLSRNAVDLSSRLDVIKSEFYKRKLDASFAPKDEEDIIWTPEWSNPKIQTINDSVSYIFYHLKPQVKRDGKMIDVKEIGAVSYIMVKNENEFYEAFFYLPSNLRSKTPSNDTPDSFMGKFTGKLLLTNLENKQSFLLDYKDGSVSDAYKKQMLASRKLLAVRGATAYTQEICTTVTLGCTYATNGLDACGEDGIRIEYNEYCMYPSSCGNWRLTDIRTQTTCETVWFPDPPIDPGDGGNGGNGNGGTFDPEDPGEEAYTLSVIADSINLSKRFECFDNVPTNANTLYSVKICADIPNNADPDDLPEGGSPGHAFLELTKTTGGISVTQTIGFYPANYHIAKFQHNVPSKVVDNENHDYDASLIKMLNVVQFNTMLAATLPAAAHQYQMVGYNCTQFALDVFNSQGYTLTISNTTGAILGYGKTPNGLYKDIKNKRTNNYPGAEVASRKGIISTKCN